MRYPAARRRIRRYPPLPLEPTVSALPGGLGVALDLGPAAFTLELRELLGDARVRGNV